MHDTSKKDTDELPDLVDLKTASWEHSKKSIYETKVTKSKLHTAFDTKQGR